MGLLKEWTNYLLGFAVIAAIGYWVADFRGPQLWVCVSALVAVWVIIRVAEKKLHIEVRWLEEPFVVCALIAMFLPSYPNALISLWRFAAALAVSIAGSFGRLRAKKKLSNSQHFAYAWPGIVYVSFALQCAILWHLLILPGTIDRLLPGYFWKVPFLTAALILAAIGSVYAEHHDPPPKRSWIGRDISGWMFAGFVFSFVLISGALFIALGRLESNALVFATVLSSGSISSVMPEDKTTPEPTANK